LAQLLLWFGQSNHINVGYNSNDPAQVRRQISDMISRGIDGVVASPRARSGKADPSGCFPVRI